jgi:tmRNA-binding protein
MEIALMLILTKVLINGKRKVKIEIVLSKDKRMYEKMEIIRHRGLNREA